MNELATMVCDYPSEDAFLIGAFDTCTDYFKWAMENNFTHLETQRNLCKDRKTAHKRFIARKRLAELMHNHIMDDHGPFIPFCDDLRPSNMLVNPDTLRIVAVVDWEFTNAMPAQYTYDPPWWLLLIGPENWNDCEETEEFMALYAPLLDRFLRAMKMVEAGQCQNEMSAEDTKEIPLSSAEDTKIIPLSERMRESWETRRFWFNYASRKSFDADIIYWEMLRQHEPPNALDSLEDKENIEVEEFVDRKIVQRLGLIDYSYSLYYV